MKIAITGGAGCIGTRLTRAYLEAGHDVIVIDSLLYKSQPEIDARARFYQLDIRNSELKTILEHERPEIVSHHAAQWHVAMPGEQLVADADVHVRGLLNVLECCVNASVKKFIFASEGNSLYAHNGTRLPVTEDGPVSPQSAYAISKVTGEWYTRYYTRHYGLKHAILRYADVYGESGSDSSGTTHPLNYFVGMLARGYAPIIRGTGEQVRDHIFIDDVVEANLRVLKRGENQTFNISSGRGYTLNQLFQAAASALESDIAPTYLSGELDEPACIMLDNTRAERVLGWLPQISLEEGVQRLIRQVGEGKVVPLSANKAQYREEESGQRLLTSA